jgi:hypothetical protein
MQLSPSIAGTNSIGPTHGQMQHKHAISLNNVNYAEKLCQGHTKSHARYTPEWHDGHLSLMCPIKDIRGGEIACEVRCRSGTKVDGGTATWVVGKWRGTSAALGDVSDDVFQLTVFLDISLYADDGFIMLFRRWKFNSCYFTTVGYVHLADCQPLKASF